MLGLMILCISAYLAGDGRKAEIPKAQIPGSGAGTIGMSVDAWSCSYLAGHGQFPKIQMSCEPPSGSGLGIIGLSVDDQLGLVHSWQVLQPKLRSCLSRVVKAAGWGPLG